MKQAILLITFILQAFILSAQPMKLEINQEATFETALFSVSEAGLDFPSSVETAASYLISVLYNDVWDDMIKPNNKWNIKVYKSDIHWNDDLVLEAKCTGKGYLPGSNGMPNLHDGDTYQQITGTPVYFFRGQGAVSSIPVQMRLSGFSLTMGAGEFETTVYFTVYDDWN